MDTYIKEEDSEHLVEDMVYLPPNNNAHWYVKDKYKQHINLYWKHNENIYQAQMYTGLP